MLLRCTCMNSVHDCVFGKGVRPHTKLVKLPDTPQEYLCNSCYYVRTLAEGTRKGDRGEKTVTGKSRVKAKRAAINTRGRAKLRKQRVQHEAPKDNNES